MGREKSLTKYKPNNPSALLMLPLFEESHSVKVLKSS